MPSIYNCRHIIQVRGVNHASKLNLKLQLCIDSVPFLLYTHGRGRLLFVYATLSSTPEINWLRKCAMKNVWNLAGRINPNCLWIEEKMPSKNRWKYLCRSAIKNMDSRIRLFKFCFYVSFSLCVRLGFCESILLCAVVRVVPMCTEMYAMKYVFLSAGLHSARDHCCVWCICHSIWLLFLGIDFLLFYFTDLLLSLRS